MQKRRLGRSGLESSVVGLGCMAMSGVYGPADREESIATIRAAVEMGVTLLDTGDFYGMGHNEMLLGEALRGIPRDAYQLSVKFGAMRDHGGAWLGFDGRPPAVKNFLAYSLQRLGVAHVDIYRPARLDPSVPIEDTVGAIADCVAAGWVRHIGLSEVGPKRYAGPPRPTRSATCRSSTRWSPATSKRGSCRPAASLGSASPPTAFSREA